MGQKIWTFWWHIFSFPELKHVHFILDEFYDVCSRDVYVVNFSNAYLYSLSYRIRYAYTASSNNCVRVHNNFQTPKTTKRTNIFAFYRVRVQQKSPRTPRTRTHHWFVLNNLGKEADKKSNLGSLSFKRRNL